MPQAGSSDERLSAGKSRLQQQVPEFGPRLDSEARRIDALQRFIRNAVVAASVPDLLALACESVVDLLGCDVSMALSLHAEQNRDRLFHFGLCDFSSDQQRALRSWTDEWVRSQLDCAAVGMDDEPYPALLPDLGLRRKFLVELLVEPSGMPFAVLFACDLEPLPLNFHASFDASAGKIFKTHARMVGELAETLKYRTRIERMDETHIEISKHQLMERRLLKAEKSQRIAKERAERENKAKSLYIAAVCHEIRTPLNGMMAAFQMLRFAGNHIQRQQLADMGESSGKWLLGIIGDSLDISRIEAGKILIMPEVFDLHQVLDELKVRNEGLALHKQIDFGWNITSEVPRWVFLDSVKLRQILANLLGNALKFTESGFVAFTVDVVKAPDGGGFRLRFCVSDSGIGFSREFRRILFQPFSQAAKEDHLPADGVGLGLAITRELVQAMGGKLKVWSRSGVGSRFIMTLPVEPVVLDEASALPLPECAMPRFHGKILLVEDDKVSAELGKMMIEQLGLHVDLANNGGEALAKATAESYDLIFMDCRLPLRCGMDVARELRTSRDGRCGNVPIIALTGNSMDSAADECREAGMNGFIAKPLLFEDLVEKLLIFLPGARVNAKLS